MPHNKLVQETTLLRAMTLPQHPTMPPRARTPLVEVDPLDIEGKTSEEQIQLALEAVS